MLNKFRAYILVCLNRGFHLNLFFLFKKELADFFEELNISITSNVHAKPHSAISNNRQQNIMKYQSNEVKLSFVDNHYVRLAHDKQWLFVYQQCVYIHRHLHGR